MGRPLKEPLTPATPLLANVLKGWGTENQLLEGFLWLKGTCLVKKTILHWKRVAGRTLWSIFCQHLLSKTFSRGFRTGSNSFSHVKCADGAFVQSYSDNFYWILPCLSFQVASVHYFLEPMKNWEGFSHRWTTLKHRTTITFSSGRSSGCSVLPSPQF